MPSAATKESLSQADIILNRTNVALARSQRLIQSWLPPKPHQDQPAAAADEREQEDEDDFRGDSEVGGIGSSAQRATDDSGLPEGAFKRRNPGANDKLLDSLLGKKAANAHRKAQALAKSAASGTGGGAGIQAAQGATSKPSAREPQKKRSAQDDSDSEEEESGRAAAFKSKRSKPSAPPLRRTPEDSVESGGANADGAEAGEPGREAEGGLEAPRETTTAPAAVKSGGGGGRKRPASYLDELLGQKANKKSKKKKKTAG